MMKQVVKHRVQKAKSLFERMKFSKSILLFLFLLLVFSTMTFLYFGQKTSTSTQWKQVEEINDFASKLDEYPKMDNDNIIKPDYTSFFKGYRVGFFARLKRSFSFSGKGWTPSDFKDLVNLLILKQSERGFKKDTVVKASIKDGDRLLIVGNLQAAFHSLVRLTNEWIRLGYLGSDLKLIKKTDRIFFVGNAINRAPYSIETLSLIMRLIEENADNVFYLQGNHEDNNYWKDFTLKQELLAKFDSKGAQEIPLEKEINEFFALLPLAWYGEVYPSGSKKFLRISHEGRDFEKLNEKKFSSFLQSAGGDKPFELQQISAEASIPADAGIDLLGLIRSEKKRKTFQTMDGMRLLPPEEGVVAWTVISCPTKVYQMGIKFFYDSFAVLNCQGKPEEWKITLHNQDVRLKNGFETRSQIFLSGEIVGVDGKLLPAPKEEESKVEDKQSVAVKPTEVAVEKNKVEAAVIKVVEKSKEEFTKKTEPLVKVEEVKMEIGVEEQKSAAAVEVEKKQVVSEDKKAAIKVDVVPATLNQVKEEISIDEKKRKELLEKKAAIEQELAAADAKEKNKKISLKKEEAEQLGAVQAVMREVEQVQPQNLAPIESPVDLVQK